jgi:hypothetical protein
MARDRAETPVQILAPERGCVTLKCGHRLIEVCAGETPQQSADSPEGDDPTVYPGIVAMKGPIDIHSLDVDWMAGNRQMVIRPVE